MGNGAFEMPLFENPLLQMPVFQMVVLVASGLSVVWTFESDFHSLFATSSKIWKIPKTEDATRKFTCLEEYGVNRQ